MADMKTQVIAELNRVFEVIDKKINENPTLRDLVKKTGQRPAHVAAGVALLLFIGVLLGFGAHALTNLIGFAYPIYASFKALKTDGQDDDTQWLTYWVVFGFFTTLESLFTFFSKSFFYFVFKAGFLIWAMLPQTQGAKLVYDNVIFPIMNRYEGKIDGLADQAKRAATQVRDETKDDVAAAVKTAKSKASAAAVDALVNDQKKD